MRRSMANGAAPVPRLLISFKKARLSQLDGPLVWVPIRWITDLTCISTGRPYSIGCSRKKNFRLCLSSAASRVTRRSIDFDPMATKPLQGKVAIVTGASRNMGGAFVEMLDARQIIDLVQLVPLTVEGGYFRETYRSALAIPAAALPPEYQGSRNVSTAIYYLLTPGTFSVIHRIASDEVFHFYAGDPVQMLQLWPDGSGRVVKIGNDLAAGHLPQLVVP